MSFDWTSFANSIVTATTAMTTAGIPASTQGSVLSNMFAGAKTRELQICAKIKQFQGNPTAEAQMLNQLVGDVNLTPQAATIAMDIAKNLVTPGYDLITRVAQLEAAINAGT